MYKAASNSFESQQKQQSQSQQQQQQQRSTPEPKTQQHHVLSEEMVSRYLARKPNFVKRWFKDNAPKDLLQEMILIKEQNEYISKRRTSLTHEMFNNIIQGRHNNSDISLPSSEPRNAL